MIHTPQKGMKEKLVELAAKNAQMILDQDKEKIKREEGRTIGAVKEIERLLGLKDLNRMEAFDISNINGFETVVNFFTPTKKRCPHLGCALKWNSAEHSWDCPCHGSRFDESGKVLDNPANGNLKH